MINAVTAAALMKAAEETLGEGQIPVGVHPIDCRILVHLAGAVEREPDGTTTSPVEIPWQLVVALLLRMLGVERARARSVLAANIRDAFAQGAELDEPLAGYMADVEAMALAAKAQQPKHSKKRTGAVRAMLTMRMTPAAPERRRPRRKRRAPSGGQPEGEAG